MPVARILGVEHRRFKIVSMKVLGLMGSRTHSALLSIDLPCFVSSCLVLLMKVMVFPVIFSLHTECVICRFSFNFANVLNILLIKCKVDITIIDGLSWLSVNTYFVHCQLIAFDVHVCRPKKYFQSMTCSLCIYVFKDNF